MWQCYLKAVSPSHPPWTDDDTKCRIRNPSPTQYVRNLNNKRKDKPENLNHTPIFNLLFVYVGHQLHNEDSYV